MDHGQEESVHGDQELEGKSEQEVQADPNMHEAL